MGGNDFLEASLATLTQNCPRPLERESNVGWGLQKGFRGEA